MRRSVKCELNPAKPTFAHVARNLTTLRVTVIPIMVASAGAASDCRGRAPEAEAQAQGRCDSAFVLEDVPIMRNDGRVGYRLPGLTDLHVQLYDASGFGGYLTGQGGSGNQ